MYIDVLNRKGGQDRLELDNNVLTISSQKEDNYEENNEEGKLHLQRIQLSIVPAFILVVSE